MHILSLDWLTSEPIDYEFKLYKLKAAIKLFNEQIDNNFIGSTLSEIETHLQNLYVFKYNKNKIDLKLMTLKGINWDKMELEYDHNEDELEVSNINLLCDESIKIFEDLYRKILKAWKDIESKFSITELSKNMQHRKHGYLIIQTTDNMVHGYTYTEPTDWNINWRFFKIIHEWSEINTLNTKTLLDGLINSQRTFRCNIGNDYPFSECVVPVSSFVLFNRIKQRG